MDMDIGELKHKLRSLKKMEDKIRFAHISDTTPKKYVWDDYFSTKSVNDLTIKYPICKLLNFDKHALKEVFEEYFYTVYFHMYKDMGLSFDEIQDPNIFSFFGLAPGASVDEIKKRFKELAKKYHPDHGGSNEKMIKLLDSYHKLVNREK